MKRYQVAAIYLVGLFFSLSGISLAQSGTVTVRDLPFFANEWVTKTSTAADGTVRSTTQQIAFARSSDGTVRREIHEASPGLDHVIGRPIILVSVLNEDTNTNSANYQGRPAVTAMARSRPQGISTAATPKSAVVGASTVPASHEITKLNGFQALLHRSQYTVPAGGPNLKARTVTSELWYSPELRISLKSTLSDSAGTTTSIVLEDIHRQEPDPALFHAGTEAKTIQK